MRTVTEPTDFETLRRDPSFDDWRWQIRRRIRSAGDLGRLLGLDTSSLDPDIERRFPIGVTPYYLSLADPADPDDPIRRQIVPIAEESEVAGQEESDPFHEEVLSPVPGVVHRYPDRALILPTNFCATLCRHCFRKRTWEDGFSVLGREELGRAVDYVRQRDEIRDVLITGGDPLHLAEETLARLLADVRAIDHVDVLRVATRVPVTLPQRIDPAMIDLLAEVRPLWLITHFNHARELAKPAVRALRDLIDAGITVQNQSVLLAGVNDSTEAQIELSRGLLRVGVRPYYLHLADPVAGAGHFRLPIERARAIVAGMYGKVTGFGIPRLVIDLPGGRGKAPIEPRFERGRDGREVRFESPIDGGDVMFLDPLGP